MSGLAASWAETGVAKRARRRGSIARVAEARRRRREDILSGLWVGSGRVFCWTRGFGGEFDVREQTEEDREAIENWRESNWVGGRGYILDGHVVGAECEDSVSAKSRAYFVMLGRGQWILITKPAAQQPQPLSKRSCY
jgi:hypothetical protein